MKYKSTLGFLLAFFVSILVSWLCDDSVLPALVTATIAGLICVIIVRAIFPAKSDCKDDYQTINTGL